MTDRAYWVYGCVKKGGYREYKIMVFAKNQKEAKECARGEWEAEKMNGHLFRMRATQTMNTPTIARMRWNLIGEYGPDGKWKTF